jgi:hypothetical protein
VCGGGKSQFLTNLRAIPPFWKAARARFMPPLCERSLPLSLWLSFELEERQRLLAVLQFLGPLTTPTAWKEFAM